LPSRPNLSISAPLGIEKITSAFSFFNNPVNEPENNNNSNIYKVKVRATLTTEKGLLNPESIETADKMSGTMITTACV
jgi:hypothetical protein